MSTNRALPGSIPQVPSSANAKTRDLYEQTCISFLTEHAIDPEAFLLKVRAIFRSNVMEGWRRIGEETLRKSTPSPNAILNELHIPLNYLDRFKREIGLSYIFSWSLRRNMPMNEVFKANPRSIAVFASAATASAIQHLLHDLQQSRSDTTDWEKRLLSSKYEVRTTSQEQTISPGDYCLLFRLMMSVEWATATPRTPKTLTPIIQRIIEEHHRDDFYIRFGSLSDLENLDGVLALFRDWNTAVSLLIWARPLNMEFYSD